MSNCSVSDILSVAVFTKVKQDFESRTLGMLDFDMDLRSWVVASLADDGAAMQALKKERT
ncbi:hypothetical protein BSU04_06595 [Caballeronia sordidicola]|uniref:Uncharacterized protein n=1 Tax=Caballeronia sordidicola TaxID=196367 RepID=A0A226X913_CABSO|nr:hypothetical protein BSU04_06595 [Caballeronia sordidicola]